MKRSEINKRISDAKLFFSQMNFHLPPWAFYAPSDWSDRISSSAEVFNNMLGWDLTDFGSGDFSKRGLLLFTIRNGNPKRDTKPYAEKIMIVEENQETPLHFHWSKMEDIINRGGGNLVLELYRSDEKEAMAFHEVEVLTDGVMRRLKAGSSLILTPGESICLTPGLYHRFYGEQGKGKVLVGEVSAVNDDTSDNRFHDSIGRFPEIDEDCEPLHLLVQDYKKFNYAGN